MSTLSDLVTRTENRYGRPLSEMEILVLQLLCDAADRQREEKRHEN